jgi:hypothetical protein
MATLQIKTLIRGVLWTIICLGPVWATSSDKCNLEKLLFLRGLSQKAVDQTYAQVSESGLKITEDGVVYLTGIQVTEHYGIWLERARAFSHKCVEIHEVGEPEYQAVVKNGYLTINRNSRFISQFSDACRSFIDRDLEAIIALLKSHRQLLKRGFMIEGRLSIYGIDDPNERDRLMEYWRTQEIKKFRTVLGVSVEFNPKG